MKKFLTIILSFIYILTSAGTVISMHYCMGKYYGSDLASVEKCSRCGMEKGKKGCCKDQYKVVKAQDVHQLFSNDISSESSFEVDNILYKTFLFDEINVDIKSVINNNSPPRSSGKSIYLRNCVFRI